jgi:hypothetical protein
MPSSKTNNNTFVRGGAPNTEAHYKYKAEKYHYKIQQKLKEMQAKGKSIPEGYERYLQPFQV